MTGATHSGSGAQGAATTRQGAAPTTNAMHGTTNAMPPAPGVKNNSGQTQGTTPGTSLPTSDGAR